MGDIKQLIPGPGVYAVKATIEGLELNVMASIGYNPTFGHAFLTVETHLFDFNEDVYGKPMEVDFIAQMRGMARFEGPEKLIEQLKADEKAARAILEKNGGAPAAQNA